MTMMLKYNSRYISGSCYVLVCFVLNIRAVDVCWEQKGCHCLDISGEISVYCVLDGNVQFDFATVNLENISHVTVKGQNIRMARNIQGQREHYPILKTLVLEGNKQQTNLTGHFLSQFMSVEHLCIKKCGLVGIERKAFARLRHVQHLDISGNGELGFHSVTAGLDGFQSTKLRLLNLSAIHLSEYLPGGNIPYGLLKSLANTSLEILDFSWSRATLLSASFTYTPRLRYLNISGTSIMGFYNCLSSIILLKEMSELVMNYWPTSTREYGVAEYKHHLRDSIGSKTEPCMEVPTRSEDGCLILGNGQTIQMHHSRATSLYINLANPTCFASNRVVNFLAAHSIISRPVNKITGLVHLEVLDLSYPEFESVSLFPGIIYTTFIDMPSLQKLLIPGNRLYLLSQDELENLFTTCGQLQLIDMSSNNLTDLPVNIFLNNTMLTHINMSRNNLETFSLELSTLKYLNTLDLSYNRFKALDQTFITKLIWNAINVSLNLEYNHFVCDCTINELISLDVHELSLTCREGSIIRFIKARNSTVSPSSFECPVEANSTMLYEYVIVICICGVIFVASISAVFYWCNIRKKKRIINHPNRAEETFVRVIPMCETSIMNRNPKFLAFVAYSHEDREFVCHILYPKLDATLRQLMPDHNKDSLVTLYDKHFLPGEDLALICEQAILQSYVTIAIVSQPFLDSFWCSYEVKTVLQANVPLIPLYLTKYDPSKLEGIFKYMFNHKVRMEWPVHCDTKIPSDDANEFITRLAEAVCANVKPLKQKDELSL